MTRYAIVVDLDYCLNCKACEVGCKIENNLPLGSQWNHVMTCGPYGTYPDLSMFYLPMQCQQCSNAPCVEVCPTGASYRDPDTNIVSIDDELCIGCLACMSGCPYNVRMLDEATNTVQKCTLCPQRTSEGELPFCVEICASGCRYYGDLDDPDSDVSKVIAAKGEDAVHRLVDSGNEPSTIYLLSTRYGDWHEDAFMDGHDTNKAKD